MDIVECIANIQKRIRDEISCINNGGCAVFACEFAERMEQRNIPATIRVMGSYLDYFDIDVNVNDVESMLEEEDMLDSMIEWESNGVSFAHVMVQWNDLIIDGHSYDTETEVEKLFESFYLLEGDISLTTVRTLAYHYHGWNEMYDPEQNDVVCKILDECFAEYDREQQTMAA